MIYLSITGIFSYTVLSVFSGYAILKDKPQPSFWKICVVYLTGCLFMLAWLGSRLLFKLATAAVFLVDLTEDKLVPPTRQGPFENRLDLH